MFSDPYVMLVAAKMQQEDVRRSYPSGLSARRASRAVNDQSSARHARRVLLPRFDWRHPAWR